MRDYRTLNMVEGQKIESDEVMKRIGDLAYRNLGTLMKSALFDSGKALIVGDGLRVEPSSNMTVNVPSGSIFQRITDVLPCLQIEDQAITLDDATGVPRVDTIEAQIKVIPDKDDITQTAIVSDSSTAVTNEAVKRDIKYYLLARKRTNTTDTTAATSGQLLGTVSIPGTIDLSEKYLINLSDGEDGSYKEIDLRGSTPEATTSTEIINAINIATGRTMASLGGSDTVVLTGLGTGQTSYFQLKPPVTDADKDCLEVVFGLSTGGIYKYTFAGENEWIKLAEIDVGASTTVITTNDIRNINNRSTWASESTSLTVSKPLFSVENTIPPGSVNIFMGETIPDGWLFCDGSAISRTVYSELFNAIGVIYGNGDGSTTFNIPDLRGTFLRGTDDGAGNDPDATSRTDRGDGVVGDNVGTKQNDAFQGHHHDLFMTANDADTGAFRNTIEGVNNLDTSSVGDPRTDGVNGTPRISAETRPRNINVNYIIKY